MRIADRLGTVAGFLGSDRSRAFYNGRLCPAIIVAIAFLGNITALELFTNLVLILFVCVGLVFARTGRPLIAFGCAFLFQISKEHSPGYQANFSDYYFTGYRLPLLVVSAALLFGTMIFYFIREKKHAKFSLKTPMLLPLGILACVLMLNGAFSDGWKPEGLLYGALQALIYAGIFLYFYLTFKGERADELLSYFTYVTSLLALLLSALVGYTFIREYLADGEVIKEDMTFGFGTWNTAGVCLAVLIPVCFIGFIKGKRPFYYLASAVLALGGAVLTMSRNAQLFGIAVFCLCFVVCCFAGGYKKLFRVLTALGILAVIVGAVLFGDKLTELFGGFFNDNGRYELWQTGIGNFLTSPIFGVGFYSFFADTSCDAASMFLPSMAHQTVIQILSSMGIVGLLGYLYYRVSTLIPFLRRISAEKILLLLSVLTLLGESMLDNFIFYFLPVIYYSFTLVVTQIMSEEDMTAPTEDADK